MLAAFTKDITALGINITKPDGTFITFDQSLLSAVTPAVGSDFAFTFGVGTTIGLYEAQVNLGASSTITSEITATESPDSTSTMTCEQSKVPQEGEVICLVPLSPIYSLFTRF